MTGLTANYKINFETFLMQRLIKIFNDEETTAYNLAVKLAKSITTLSQVNNIINIAISGGSTPIALFKILASNFSKIINWSLINIFWVDERCVPPLDIDSNYRSAKIQLFDKIAIPANNIFRILGEDKPEDESIRYSDTLNKIVASKNGLPNFDMVLLGIGNDGHTASIFPDQLELLTVDKVCSLAFHPLSGQKRITLTGRVINNASEVIYFVTGENKSGIISDILAEPKKAKHYPAFHIKALNGITSYYLDKDAAKELN